VYDIIDINESENGREKKVSGEGTSGRRAPHLPREEGIG
jgi:hypothetical protein